LRHRKRKQNLKHAPRLSAIGFIGTQRAAVTVRPIRKMWVGKMSEKRAAVRYRVLKRGTIAFGGGGFDCTVRNLSTGGARLDVADPTALPDTFLLVIEADQFMRRCRPVWNDRTQIGVAFQ
jgi:hypothetical protein